MKKFLCFIGLFVSMFLTPCMAIAADDDYDFDFDNFAIVDDEPDDINLDSISLNSDASPVDVNQFDIAGAMLGMTYEEINDLFFENSALYAPRQNNSIIYTINKDWEYNLDYECRQSNIFVPDQLKNCIRSLAQNRGLLYVSEVHLERAYTGETIDIYFTSNASNNVVWKIVYKNDAGVLDGIDDENSETFANQREKKILNFWQGVLDKYGIPNSGEDKWISSENAYDPMMQAYYGQLELIDNGLNASDTALNIQSARDNFQAKPYAF